MARRRLAGLDDLAEEPVEVGRRDAAAHAVAERERLGEQPGHVAAGLRARRQDLGPQPQLLGDPGALVLELGDRLRRSLARTSFARIEVLAGEVPLVQDE